MSSTFRNFFSSAMFFIYSVNGILINLVSIWMNYYKFYILTHLICMIALQFSYLYLIETPYFFYHKKKIYKLYDSLSKIASRNFTKKETNKKKLELFQKLRLKITNFDIIIESNREKSEIISERKKFDADSPLEMNEFLQKLEKTNSENQGTSYSFLNLFKKSNIVIFCHFVVILIYLEIGWGFSLIINQDMGIENVFLNGIFIHFIQALSYYSCMTFLKKATRKAINIQMNLVVIIFSFLLLILNIVSKIESKQTKKQITLRIFNTSKANQFFA